MTEDNRQLNFCSVIHPLSPDLKRALELAAANHIPNIDPDTLALLIKDPEARSGVINLLSATQIVASIDAMTSRLTHLHTTLEDIERKLPISLELLPRSN